MFVSLIHLADGASEETNSVPFTVNFAGNSQPQQRKQKKKKQRFKQKNEEEEFVRVLRESQKYLDTKVDAFDKRDVTYKAQVKQNVAKYIKSSVHGYDHHINTDLNRLLSL